MGLPWFAEWIEMGDEVAEVAVSMNEQHNAGLPACIQRRRGQAVRAKLEALKEETPALVNRSGILLPLAIGRFDVFQVPACSRRFTHHCQAFQALPSRENFPDPAGRTSAHQVRA